MYKLKLLLKIIKDFNVKYFKTDTKIEAGKAIFIINLDIFPLKLSLNHSFSFNIYPKTINKTMDNILPIDVKNASIF